MKTQRQVTKGEIESGLKGLGVTNGAVILVHSSLSKIGLVEGGADALVDALVGAVGSEGTVLVPTLTGSEKLGKDNPPAFDVENTPCWTGKVPETFRKRPEAVRSLHPTHSVSAIGKDARELTNGHEDSLTPCGKGSPYWKVAERGGGFLFIGVDLESCTFFHTLEEIAKAPYHLQPEKVNAAINAYGRQLQRELFIHKYGTPVHFNKPLELLEKGGALKKGKVGDAVSMLLNGRKAAELLLPILEKDNLYFTKRGN